jgi:hypothetical protein
MERKRLADDGVPSSADLLVDRHHLVETKFGHHRPVASDQADPH